MDEHKGVCKACGANDVNINEENKCENCAPRDKQENK